MDEIFSQLLLESASKSTAGIWVIVGELALIGFSIVVVIGLYGETKTEIWSPPTPRVKLWHKLFVAFVTIGVAGELISDGDIFLFSHRLQSIQELEVARLNDRAATAEEAAGKANERAAKAELEIAKLKAPRIITPEQANNLIALLRPYAGEKFWITTHRNDQDAGSEQMLLSGQILQIFLNAGWIRNSHLSIGQTIEEHEFEPISDRGCNIATAGDAKSLALRKVLFDGLKSADLECSQNIAFGFLEEAVVIEIGLR